MKPSHFLPSSTHGANPRTDSPPNKELFHRQAPPAVGDHPWRLSSLPVSRRIWEIDSARFLLETDGAAPSASNMAFLERSARRTIHIWNSTEMQSKIERREKFME